jgi:hypothetical protein
MSSRRLNVGQVANLPQEASGLLAADVSYSFLKGGAAEIPREPADARWIMRQLGGYMSVLIGTVVLAAVNFCLGYLLAVYLGCGPPSLKSTWKAMSADGPAVAPDAGDERCTSRGGTP